MYNLLLIVVEYSENTDYPEYSVTTTAATDIPCLHNQARISVLSVTDGSYLPVIRFGTIKPADDINSLSDYKERHGKINDRFLFLCQIEEVVTNDRECFRVVSSQQPNCK